MILSELCFRKLHCKMCYIGGDSVRNTGLLEAVQYVDNFLSTLDVHHFCFSTVKGEQPFLPLLLMGLMRVNEIICSLSLKRNLSG